MSWIEKKTKHPILGGGFKDFSFYNCPGEPIQFESYISNGLKPPTRKASNCFPFHFMVVLCATAIICVGAMIDCPKHWVTRKV